MNNTQTAITYILGFIVAMVLLATLNVWGNNRLEMKCESKGGTFLKSVESNRSLCEMKGDK